MKAPINPQTAMAIYGLPVKGQAPVRQPTNRYIAYPIPAPTAAPIATFNIIFTSQLLHKSLNNELITEY